MAQSDLKLREVEPTRADVIRRLKRIEGQVRGVQRMIEEERACGEVLAQLSAINEAVRSVSARFAEDYAVECLAADASKTSNRTSKSRETAAALVEALMRAPR
jgi:DNA-binding FrmR family transcriptional regulator